MESKEKTTDITVIIANLTQKVLQLQEKLDFLCKSTGNCEMIKKVHRELTAGQVSAITKETKVSNGINIDPLCKEE